LPNEPYWCNYRFGPTGTRLPIVKGGEVWEFSVFVKAKGQKVRSTISVNFLDESSNGVRGTKKSLVGEFDIKTCIAMLIMDRLEIGGSFAEFHPIDFDRDTILVGHDGPHHLNISNGKPVIRSLKNITANQDVAQG
jgi:L-arabinose isomerase